MSYWKQRELDELTSLADITIKSLEDEIANLYSVAAKNIIKEMTALYDKIQANTENPLVSDLYKYGRYYSMLNQINAELTKLSKEQIRIMDKKLKRFAVDYSNTINAVYNLANTVDIKAAEAVVDSVWATDGKNYSDRIWANKDNMMKLLEQGLFNCLVRGADSEELTLQLSKTFNVNYKVAKRLVRTEISYLQTRMAVDRYKASNIKQYKYLTLRDDKVCTYCKPLDQKILDIDKIEIGVNAPPMHPNCRCLIAPVVRIK